MFWADPTCDLICVALANRVIANGWASARPHSRWQSLSDAVVDALSD